MNKGGPGRPPLPWINTDGTFFTDKAVKATCSSDTPVSSKLTQGMLVVSVITATWEGEHQQEGIPGALCLALAKGDEGSFKVLSDVLHALVERATSCLSCPAQLRRGIEKEIVRGNLGESVPDTADAGDPAAPGRHDGGRVDAKGRKPSEPGRNTHDPGQQLQPVPVSTQTGAGLSRPEAATGDLHPSHSL